MFHLSAPTQTQAFQTIPQVLSSQEIDQITKQAHTYKAQSRTHEMRHSTFYFIPTTDKTQWLYQKMSRLIHTVNAQHFGYDLTEIPELQFTEYHGTDQGEFRDHLDWAPNTVRPRKLSMSIQLSESHEYDGGDLQLKITSDRPIVASRTKGDAIIYPGFLLHGVTRVTKGVRRALIVWVMGPEFR